MSVSLAVMRASLRAAFGLCASRNRRDRQAFGAHQQMPNHALGQLQRALDLGRALGWQLEPAEDVDAIAKTADRIGQALAAPDINAFNGAATLAGQICFF